MTLGEVDPQDPSAGDPVAADGGPALPDDPLVDAAASPDALLTTLPTVIWNGRVWAWDRSGNNGGYPKFEGDDVVLTPNQNGRAGVIFLVEEHVPPYTVEFEYATRDNDGCTLQEDPACAWRSADGLVFMFAKDVRAYETAEPPVGSARGFIADGTGHGIHFRLYDPRGIGLRDGDLTLVVGAPEETYWEDWRAVRVFVEPNRVRVYLDGDSSPFLDHAAAWDPVHRFLGFGAGTGGAAAEHRLRSVVITP